MLTFLPTFIRLPLALLLVALNVLVHGTVLLLVALIKALVPIAVFRRGISRLLIAIAEQWIAVNGMLFALFTRTRWVVDGLEDLRRGHALHRCQTRATEFSLRAPAAPARGRHRVRARDDGRYPAVGDRRDDRLSARTPHPGRSARRAPR